MSGRLVAVASAAVFLAAPAQATFTNISDLQIRINAVLVFDDPQEGDDPSSSGDFDTGTGRALGFANFSGILGTPLQHNTAAEIRQDSETTDTYAVQTFAQSSLGWSVTDIDLGRTGPVNLRADFTLDWNLAYGTGSGGFASAFFSYHQFDTDSNILLTLGSASCTSINRAAPTCSGTTGFDLSLINVVFNGTSWDITGTATLDFMGGSVNGLNLYYGPGTGTSISLPGGAAEDFIAFGAGNTVDWNMTSTESSVTVTPVPEPAAAGLLGLGLVALAAGRRAGLGSGS